jgi:hypothetical protein
MLIPLAFNVGRDETRLKTTARIIRRSWLSLRAVKQRPANAPDKIQNSEQGMYILLDREKLTTTNGKAPKKTR